MKSSVQPKKKWTLISVENIFKKNLASKYIHSKDNITREIIYIFDANDWLRELILSELIFL